MRNAYQLPIPKSGPSDRLLAFRDKFESLRKEQEASRLNEDEPYDVQFEREMVFVRSLKKAYIDGHQAAKPRLEQLNPVERDARRRKLAAAAARRAAVAVTSLHFSTLMDRLTPDGAHRLLQAMEARDEPKARRVIEQFIPDATEGDVHDVVHRLPPKLRRQLVTLARDRALTNKKSPRSGGSSPASPAPRTVTQRRRALQRSATSEAEILRKAREEAEAAEAAEEAAEAEAEAEAAAAAAAAEEEAAAAPARPATVGSMGVLAALRRQKERGWEPPIELPDLLHKPTKSTQALSIMAEPHKHADRMVKHGLRAISRERCLLAIKKYGQALLLDPSNRQALFHRGIAYSKLGEFALAAADFSRVIEQKSTFLAHFNRGVAYAYSGEDLPAIDDFSRAIQLQPGDADSYHNRALLYRRQGMYLEAQRDYMTMRTVSLGVSTNRQVQQLQSLAAHNDRHQRVKILTDMRDPLVAALEETPHTRTMDQIDRLVHASHGIKYLQQYPRDALAALWRHMAYQRMPKNTTIFNKGDESHHFYIIWKGNVSVRVCLEGSTKEVVVATMTAGKAFGEDSLLTGKPRNATLVTETSTELLVLEKAAYDSTIGQFSKQRFEDKVAFMERTMLFGDWTDAQLRSLVSLSKEHAFRSGDKVVAQGEPADALFFLYRGVVKVTKHLDDLDNPGEPADLILASLTPGDIFGEASVKRTMLGDGLYPSSVVAHSIVTVLRVDVRQVNLDDWGEDTLERIQKRALYYPSEDKLIQYVHDKRSWTRDRQRIMRTLQKSSAFVSAAAASANFVRSMDSKT